MTGKTKILITEDEGVVALHLERTIQNLGYEVTGIAESKAEVIKCIDENRPDLILMDILIKGGEDGISTAEYVKKKYRIPIVFLTAHSDANTLAKVKLTEPFGYLIKPFEQRELAVAIEIAVYKSNAEWKLNQSRDALENMNRKLDGLVNRRTVQLEHVNKKLKEEIAEKEQVEKELIVSENRYRGLFVNAMDAIIAINAEGEIQLCNPAAEKMFGYSTRQILGKNVKLLLPKLEHLSYDMYPGKNDKTKKKNIPVIGRDIKAKRKDGTLFDAELRIHEAKIDEEVRFIAFIRDISQIVEAEFLLQEERKRRLTALIDGQELERNRLARELHDGLGQMLMGVKLSASRLNRQKTEGVNTDKAFKNAMELIDASMLEARSMSQNLMPSLLKDFGLPAALKKMVAILRANSDVSLSFSSTGATKRWNASLEVGVYRVAQEATANALKHSKADKIKISLVNTKKALRLDVNNNGKSFDVEKARKNGGSGFLNMQERAVMLDGELSIISTNGDGTRVRLTIQNDQ